MSIIKTATSLKDRIQWLLDFVGWINPKEWPEESKKEHCIWVSAAYVVLHFDLVTRNDGKDLDRSDTNTRINAFVADGFHLGGSVYALRADDKAAALKKFAALKTALGTSLVPGDSFYMHYADIEKKGMGVLAQVVPDSGNALTLNPASP